ncbi:ATPase/histidine kinase/DNA gyrase B/HSP90 domain protein [Desulfamplus magnetovallimortis]|uniref:histidine kinase n=2 Tax=Desulfamplus magnetovallimortis TaxID=1246637 RepID=A0A1W1HFM2_9BACT|nr:ATPase/histidine kinase/DNA gyrase B/HSP90 domain protein [Desulfamplus magnetovallimortis]
MQQGNISSNRSIIFFWVLLVIPTIIIATAAFNLLEHEQERINQSALAALTDGTYSIAGTIHTTVSGIQKNLTRSLVEIHHDQIEKTLTLWKETNPLIRNIFILSENKGLIYPFKGDNILKSTNEEQRFIKRYDSLFSGQTKWVWKSDRIYQPGDNTLLDFASPEPFESKSSGNSGWIPWFSENRLFILGWVKSEITEEITLPGNRDSKKNEPLIYGVELELMTLLSGLITALPTWKHQNAAYTIQNGSSEILHQAGSFPVSKNSTPHIIQPISPLLPYWQIAAYLDEKSVESRTSFMVISVMLLSVFLISILSGAGLITWQAITHRRDALQKTSFVSSVSHELKTPLTSIRMYAELLQSGRVNSTDKKAGYLAVIVDESQRLTRLVNNILDFGRLEQGRKTYNKTDFDLGQLILNIVKTHNIRLQEAGMVSEISIPDYPLPVKTDRDALEQIILNIVDNAVKYASSGVRISFSIKLHEQNIDKRESSYYTLSICDSGPGIPKIHRKKIFDKFHRVDDSLTSRKPGSGLGLSIARKMARDLGGDLLLVSPPSGGCCFNIKIRL